MELTCNCQHRSLLESVLDEVCRIASKALASIRDA